MSEGKTLDLKTVKEAVSGTAVAFRSRVELQPAGGPGDKVFPPTYEGATYATEARRLPGREEPVACVLLDSVQSQANRMEEALQEAVDAGRIRIPLIEVDFGQANQELLKPIDDRITSLTVPHRLADAILRDSDLEDGTAFSKSEHAEYWRKASVANATPVYELCPTALIFGIWGAPEKPGGLGAKFERLMSSEILGMEVAFGTKTSSRIDPLGIRAGIGIYDDGKGNWTLENTGKKYGRNRETAGKPSAINHGNVTPALAKYGKNPEGLDPMKDFRERARQGEIAPGGVTMASAEQTTVVSLAGLRRLKFPPKGEKWQPSDGQRRRDLAARTVLASLALCAAELAAESGMDLRSRCVLWPSAPRKWELLDAPGEEPVQLAIGAESAIALLNEAVSGAEAVGMTWQNDPIRLRPSEKLVNLVKRSQELAATAEEEGE